MTHAYPIALAECSPVAALEQGTTSTSQRATRLLDFDRLGCDVEGIFGIGRALLTALEVELTAGIYAAMVRYLAARVRRDNWAELEMRRIAPRVEHDPPRAP
jgi:hypothetical protein